MAELAVLERELEAALADRRCRLVTVVGEPGVGKSRLAAELVGRVDARAVHGGCLSYGEGITYWALAQIVRELAGIRDDQLAEQAPGPARELPRGRAGRRRGHGADRPAPRDRRGSDDRGGARLGGRGGSFPPRRASGRSSSSSTTSSGPKQALLDLLAGLPAALEDVQLLVCCLARPELLETRPEWPVTVRLEPLGDGGARRASREPRRAAGEPQCDRPGVGRATRSSPRSWSSGRARADDATAAFPTTLNALLGARLDRLDARTRDALERGAIEGEVFHRGAVVELSDARARPCVPGELEAARAQGSHPPHRRRASRARRPSGSSTSSSGRRRTARPRRSFAPSCTSGSPDWLERLAGERMAEYEEIVGYHLEQSYRYRIELGGVDDETRALGERRRRSSRGRGAGAPAREATTPPRRASSSAHSASAWPNRAAASAPGWTCGGTSAGAGG